MNYEEPESGRAVNAWSNGQGAGEAQRIEAAGQAFQHPRATFLPPIKKEKEKGNPTQSIIYLFEPLKLSFILIYHL